VRNFGVPGATLLRKGNKPYWTLDAIHAATGFNPQIVVLKLGTNDSKPKNWAFQDGFEKDCGDLIDHFAILPAKPKIWVCLPAPAAPNRFGIDGAIIKNQVIPRIRKAAAAKKVPTIDLDAAFNGRMDLLPDNVHPNEAGAALIARSVHAALTIKTD
jgi:lysophospholipase L1-like esterase